VNADPAAPPPAAGASAGIERIAAAFAGSGKRAALMPYLMGGFPDLAASRAIGEAYADGDADIVELGVPFSDPLADGPVIQAAGTRALAAGATVDSVLEVAAALAPHLPVVVMAYANLVFARGAERFAGALAAAGASGLIVPDLPLEEAPAALEACDAAGVALVPLVAPTTPDERLAAIGARARGFIYTVSVTGTTGERASLADAFSAVVGRAKAHAPVPVALGFGIATAEHAVQAAEAGADGVIVGSRLVRAAGEAADPAAAVREVVAGMAAALRA
jgi:tryptophan synthase alpha chain